MAKHKQFPLAVIINRKSSKNRWIDYSWRVSGVVVTERLARGECIHSDPVAGDDFLWGGIHLNLYKDQVESYYHNLMAPQAMLYVIVRVQDNILTPVLVSASFDEANAYIESSDDAHPVPMPAEVYPWVERFVLEHYQPEPPRKRKRKNWK